jgi:hypothetical protein
VCKLKYASTFLHLTYPYIAQYHHVNKTKANSGLFTMFPLLLSNK